jgi:hypothetical protein
LRGRSVAPFVYIVFYCLHSTHRHRYMHQRPVRPARHCQLRRRPHVHQRLLQRYEQPRMCAYDSTAGMWRLRRLLANERVWQPQQHYRMPPARQPSAMYTAAVDHSICVRKCAAKPMHRWSMRTGSEQQLLPPQIQWHAVPNPRVRPNRPIRCTGRRWVYPYRKAERHSMRQPKPVQDQRHVLGR